MFRYFQFQKHSYLACYLSAWNLAMVSGSKASVWHRDRLCSVLPRRLQPCQRARVYTAAAQNGDEAATKIIAQGRTPVFRSSSTFKVQLIKPTEARSDANHGKLLVYLPGTDGTGQAILPQIPALQGLGYDVWCLCMPPDDRSDWEQLTTQLTLLLRQLLQHWRASRSAVAPASGSPRITIVAESFGCCLALRLAASGAWPELLDRLVLVNPATSFNDSLSGLASLIAATNLLSLFPRDWYAVAQTTLLPLLVDSGRVDGANQQLLQSMILMEPPDSRQAFGFSAARPPQSVTAAGQAAPNSDAPTAAAANGDADNGRSALYYGPAAAANFRVNLLRSGDPGEAVLRQVAVPVLLVTSARDRLLPSIAEGARLERVLPNAQRFILPDSAHAALLERGVNLAAVMQAMGFADDVVSAPAKATTGTSDTGPAVRSISSSTLRPMSSVAGTVLHPRAALPAGLPSPTASCDQDLTFTGRDVSANGTSGQKQGRGAQSVGTLEAPTGRQYARPSALPPLEAALAEAAAATAAVGFPASANGSPLSELSMRGRQKAAAADGIAPEDDGRGSPSLLLGSRRSTVGDGGEAKTEQAPSTGAGSAFDEWCQKLAPWRDVVSPVVLGFEHLPPPGSPDFRRPMLFVGNHQKMGFYDTPLLVYELYVRGYRVRGLAHPGHWAGPFGRWFESFGSVKASPMAAFRLLRASEKVLLFPGGAKEVVKKRGQEYKLLWKESPDFVRLAARCNALIVPFAAVGADDAYDVIMDTDEVIAHPVLGPLTTGLLSRVSNSLDPAESIFPITRLPVVGLPTPIPIPNLQRLYFQFAPPIDPCALGTDINNRQQVQKLYDGVKGTVTQCMSELLAVRDADEESQLGARITKSLQRIVPVLGAAPGASSPSG